MYNYTSFISSTDRFGIFGTEEYQVQKLARRLKCSIEDILKAVQEVGFDQDEIEEYIRDRNNRS